MERAKTYFKPAIAGLASLLMSSFAWANDDPSANEAAAFLLSASFGPTQESIDDLVNIGYSEWFRRQQEMPINYVLDEVDPQFADTSTFRWELVPRTVWFDKAIHAEDQLRQRAAFALSQIFVVSTESRNWSFKSHLQARYMDFMQEGVFGNFRDIMNNVTYSPLMGEWLSYIGNEKANAETGNAPDENYARELMQLFTIGLVELRNTGRPRLDGAGQVIETYDTTDVSELAKVFTGLWWTRGGAFGSSVGRPAVRARDIRPLRMYNGFHSPEAKTFLGHTIPANTSGDESIAQALDVLFNHSNVGPFISKQLIQRMTTSNPRIDYVRRVTAAFNSGSYTMPDGTTIGSGERGDMAPVWAAILFDVQARSEERYADRSQGKVREPLIRFLHWARLAGNVTPQIINDENFSRDGTTNTLGQNPYRANSVFNYYRPGFSAGGSTTAANNLVAPELQITTSTTAVNYPNFMKEYIFRDTGRNWVGSYEDQINLARNADDLIDHLNLTMTAGQMTDRTIQRVRDTINSVDFTQGNNNNQQNSMLRDRVQLAMLLISNSAEYNTQH